MPISRPQIVDVGLRLLDEEGLAGLTLRRLAERLEIRAPTLYWHVRDKRELLGLLAAAIAEEAAADLAEESEETTWPAWVRSRAGALRACLLRHRDGAVVVCASRPSLAELGCDRRATAALVARGLTPACAKQLMSALVPYVLGAVLSRTCDGALDARAFAAGIELLIAGVAVHAGAELCDTAGATVLTP